MENQLFMTNERITFEKNWLILIPLCCFLLYDFIQINIMGGMSTFILSTLHISNFQLGIASSLFFYVNLLLLPISGPILDKYLPKNLVAISIGISVVGTIIFALFPSYTTLLLWRALGGICGAFSYLSCVKMLSTYFPRNRIGLLLGLTGIVIMSAGLIAQYPMVAILKSKGLQFALFVNALGGISVMALVLILVYPINTSSLKSSATTNTNKSPYLSMSNWLIAFFAAFNNFPLFIIGALWGNLYLQSTYGLGVEQAAMITSMIFFGNIFGAPILGQLSDRSGNRKPFMIFSSLLYISSLLLIMTMTHKIPVWSLFGLFFILGFSTGAQTLAYASIVDINIPQNTAKATSLLSFLSVGAGAVCQPLFAWISGIQQNYQHGMLLVVGAALLSLLIGLIYFPSPTLRHKRYH